MKILGQNAAIFSRCKNERSAFRKICATNDVVAVIPPVPNNTRWFADLMMLEAFLKVEKGIKLHATQSEKMIPLTAADWKNARGYVDILKPFHTATKLEEGENYVTLSSVIPVISILHEKTSAYLKNRHNNGFGIMFARNMLASLEDRFGRYPDFLLMKPHCLATFTDPRFARMYFSKKHGMEPVLESVIELAKEEIEVLQPKADINLIAVPQPIPAEIEKESFWGTFDKQLDTPQNDLCSLDSEISMWGGFSALSRTANPMHVMTALKKDYPRLPILPILKTNTISPDYFSGKKKILASAKKT